MKLRLSAFTVFVLLGLLIAGCARVPRAVPANQTIHQVEGVPFYPDARYQCGPASLAGVLGYHGDDVEPDRIAEKIYSASARGTLTVDMAWYAEQRGMNTRVFEGNLDAVHHHLDHGRPLIVLIAPRPALPGRSHFMVITGYTPSGIIVNSGTYERRYYSNQTFLELWSERDHWTLLIRP